MANQNVRFVRMRGRIVPIKAKPGDSQHIQQGLIGAVQGVAFAGQLGAMKAGSSKGALIFGAANAGLGITGLVKNFNNAVAHAKQKRSTLHGIGRFITNNFANNIGLGLGLGTTAGIAKSYIAAKTVPLSPYARYARGR